jgi:hypothetical protein
MRRHPVKVLYIAGEGRSGSTILGRIIGNLNGFVSTGELRLIWQHGLIQNIRCGCGVPFRECPWWTAVLAAAFGGTDQVDAHEMSHYEAMLPVPRYALHMALFGETSFLRRRFEA